MSAPANVIAFREVLQRKFPEAHGLVKPPSEVWATGVACLDEAGLPRGRVTEVVGGSLSAGVGLLVAALLRRQTPVTEYTALIDGSDAFDPWSVGGRDLERLLWVRCRELPQAIKAADLLLRDGNIPLVLLDLQLYPVRELLRLPGSVWHRLRLLGEKSGVTTCIFTPGAAVAGAAARLVMQSSFGLADVHLPAGELVPGLKMRPEAGRTTVWQAG